MSATQAPDLRSREGPDDWVSLFLDGGAEDMLTDLQLPDLPDHSTCFEADMECASGDAEAAVDSSRLPSHNMYQSRNSLSTEDLCLPSLDDLLAELPSREHDAELFSGFDRLDNTGLTSVPNVREANTQSHQGSNMHDASSASQPPGPQTSSNSSAGANASSNSSEGELCTAAAPVSSQESHPSPQAHPGTQPQQDAPASANRDSLPAHAQLQPAETVSARSEPVAVPSLVGMTAAQVAEAVGYTGSQAQQVVRSQPGNKHAATSKLAVRKQANAKKKRVRDAEPPSTALLPVADDAQNQHQQNGPAQTAPVDVREVSPGVSQNGGTGPAEPAQEHSSGNSAAGDEEYQKRMARMQRNRDSAHQSRQRKRMQMEEVEQRCQQLKQHNSQLNQLVGCLTAENMTLKQQLVNVCHQTGTPLPPPPGSAIPPFGFGQMGMPLLPPAPKIPIQKMPHTRPSHVPSSASSQQSSQHQASAQTAAAPPTRAHKRAKQAAGAGTVLLALFSFVVLVGPLGPFSSSPALKIGQSVPAGQNPSMGGLPSAPADFGQQALGGGRVLMSVDLHDTTGFAGHSNQTQPRVQNATTLKPVSTQTQLRLQNSTSLIPVSNPIKLRVQNRTAMVPLSNETQLMLANSSSQEVLVDKAHFLAEGSGDNSALLEKMIDSTEVKPEGASGVGWWSELLEAAHVEPSKSIVLRPSNREVESQALQGLKDLAPYVLAPHQWDQGFTPARLPSGQGTWQQALPGAAAVHESSGLNGLNSPNMCTEVFHFEAQEVTTVQATQHAQRYLAGASGSSMRGSGSIALPPVPTSQGVQDSRSKKRRQTTIGCGEDSPDVVVSVMLPTKSERSADNEFTSLDQLYVVVLTPGVKYATYSCLLPKPVLV